MTDHHTERSERFARWILALGLAAVLAVMVGVSRDYGATWDELPRQAYGERIVRFYRGEIGMERFPADGSHLYGGLFDVAVVGFQNVLPFDKYNVRHGVTAVAGWLSILACALVAARLGGPWAGVLAVLLAATAPRYFAHSMNNPKDIPFAAFAGLTLVGLCSIRPSYPYLPVRVASGLAVAIGLALAVRPGGVLFLFYAAGAVAIAVVRQRDVRVRHLLVTAAMLALVTAVATTIPLAVWPWLQTRPYVGLIEAVRGVSHFEWKGLMLFNGRDVLSTEAPWTYVPVWMWYTTPPVVLAGLALSLLRLRHAATRLATLGLWFTVLFPVVYIVARGSTIYDEIRHVLFIMPSVFALAALGWHEVLVAARGWGRYALVALVVLGLAEPVVFSVRNHPNQVVYFNPLLGGPRAAAGRFELDYWGNCHYQAMQYAAALAIEARSAVSVSGRRWLQMRLDVSRLPSLYVTNHDRGIHQLEVRHVRGPREAVLELMRQPAFHRVATADGTPLCLVVAGPAYHTLEARLARTRSLTARPTTRE